MPERKKQRNIETLKGVADGVINKGKHIKRKREGRQMVKISPDKNQLESDRINCSFKTGNTWHGAFSDWLRMSHVSCVNTIVGPVYTRWATPRRDRLMHCSLFEIPVAQAEFSASGPVRLQHNENFKRKHGMSRASPADRAGSSQTNRPVDRCHTSNFTRAGSRLTVH